MLDVLQGYIPRRHHVMRHFFTLLCFVFSLSLSAQDSISPLDVTDLEQQKIWVDSIYNSLNLKEKIGQLYMVQVFSSQDQKTKASVLNQIKTHHIGGVIFSKGGPVRQAHLNNELQGASKIPLLVGMDAEWGLSMRLDSTYAFPWNMTLGAVKNLDLDNHMMLIDLMGLNKKILLLKKSSP